jgi:hypothetical protein
MKQRMSAKRWPFTQQLRLVVLVTFQLTEHPIASAFAIVLQIQILKGAFVAMAKLHWYELAKGVAHSAVSALV